MSDDRLSRYVNGLFARHRMTPALQEMKDEILTNLEEKLHDYLDRGLPYEDAFRETVKDLPSIDNLIDGRRPVYVVRFFMELLQTALLYCVIAWIVTIPARIMLKGMLINTLLMIITILVGVIYMGAHVLVKNAWDRVAALDAGRLLRWKRWVWWLWAAFVAAVLAGVLAVRFGSNLWFWRPVHISGPYQFADLALSLTMPFLSIIVPLLVNKANGLLGKHEVKD